MISTVVELQEAILGLSEVEYTELRRWLIDQDWERWERKFDEDVRAGRSGVCGTGGQGKR